VVGIFWLGVIVGQVAQAPRKHQGSWGGSGKAAEMQKGSVLKTGRDNRRLWAQLESWGLMDLGEWMSKNVEIRLGTRSLSVAYQQQKVPGCNYMSQRSATIAGLLSVAC